VSFPQRAATPFPNFMRGSASPTVAPSSAVQSPDDSFAADRRATPSRRVASSFGQAPSAPTIVATQRSRTLEAAVEPRAVGVTIAVVIHAALLLAIWNYAQPRTAAPKPKSITVELLAPAPVERPPPPSPPRKVAVKPLAQAAPRAEPPPPQVDLPVETPPSVAVTLPPPKPDSPPAVAIAAPVETTAPPQPPVTPPRFDADYLRNPAPDYPPMARRHGEQGRVMLRVLVGADGDPREIVVKTSSGFERLDRAAQETVRRWRFVPARMGTVAVDAWVIVPIVFALAR